MTTLQLYSQPDIKIKERIVPVDFNHVQNARIICRIIDCMLPWPTYDIFMGKFNLSKTIITDVSQSLTDDEEFFCFEYDPMFVDQQIPNLENIEYLTTGCNDKIDHQLNCRNFILFLLTRVSTRTIIEFESILNAPQLTNQMMQYIKDTSHA